LRTVEDARPYELVRRGEAQRRIATRPSPFAQEASEARRTERGMRRRIFIRRAFRVEAQRRIATRSSPFAQEASEARRTERGMRRHIFIRRAFRVEEQRRIATLILPFSRKKRARPGAPSEGCDGVFAYVERSESRSNAASRRVLPLSRKKRARPGAPSEGCDGVFSYVERSESRRNAVSRRLFFPFRARSERDQAHRARDATAYFHTSSIPSRGTTPHRDAYSSLFAQEASETRRTERGMRRRICIRRAFRVEEKRRIETLILPFSRKKRARPGAPSEGCDGVFSYVEHSESRSNAASRRLLCEK